MKQEEKAGEKFEQLVQIMETLRGDRGCPWDKEQDEKSITNYFLEEVYEAVEAISANDTKALAEELGDVLMEVVFLAQIYKEKRKFSIDEVLNGINQKMVRRHPHVFGPERKETSREVVDDWIRGKKEEKERESLFDRFPNSTPSLLAAFQIGLRVSHYGFDWSQAREALQKVKEEVVELEKVIDAQDKAELSREMGDVFFSLVNVSRLLGINPEIALRQANKKFIKRFKYIEKKLKEEKKGLGQTSLEEMDKIWEEAKVKIK
jgi:MazG family protein